MTDSQAETTASRLASHREEILNHWLEQAKSELPSARYQSAPVLRDELPVFLDELANALDPKTSATNACDRDPNICREHGEQRAGLAQYSLKEVIQEYILLKKSLFEVLGKSGPLTLSDRDCITRSIDEGILEASAEYVKVQDEIRQQFIAILTHDLRNPLSAVRMSAQMILRQPTNNDIVEHFSSRIIESVKRIDDMIRDLLDASRVRVGERVAVQKTPCDLVMIAKEVLTEFATVNGDRFILRSPNEIKGVWSRDGLRRMLENLLNNAVKYGDSGKIKVVLEEEEGGISISVHNSGNPIAPEELPNLFNPYNRTAGAETNAAGGWGLGLTQVKGMAEAHGGTVSVKSSEPEGTTFKTFIRY